MQRRNAVGAGLVGLLLSGLLVGATAGPVLGDSGCVAASAPSLVGGVYEVDTAAKLQWVKDSGSMSASYKLTANINLSGCTWSNGIGTSGTAFSGVFDGNNKTVSNLTISGGSTAGLGLIDYLSGTLKDITIASPSVTGTSNYVSGAVGSVKATATVTNVTLTSVTVSGGQFSGGAFGDIANGATVSNVTVGGAVTANDGAGGGVVGSLAGSLSNVVSSVNVTGSFTLGGIAGSMGSTGSLTNATSSGDVTGTSSTVGGAVGSGGGTSPTCSTITGVSTSGNVSGTTYVAGVLAYGNCYFVRQSSSSSTITASSSHAGGIVGYDNFPGRVEKAYFTGSVTATESVGGIAGLSRSVIVDSWSSGSVTATSATNGGRAGGLVGWFRNTGGAYPNAEITRAYARGAVTPPAGGSSTVGGLVGDYSSGTITGGIWDTQTTGRSTSQGTGAKGYTSQQLKDYVMYDADNLNWDITDGISSGNGISTGTVWSVCSGANSGYPFLTRQGLSGSCRPTMAYNGNGNTGGTAPVDASTPYVSGDTVTVMGNTGNMTKTSFVFSGWNTKADGTGVTYSETDTFIITAPVMLFAQWTTTPQIIYNANGGTGTIANTSGASGSTVTLSSGSGFTRTGYVLSRWDTASAGTGTPYSKSQSITMPAGGLTLYAVWTALPAITYNANGGTGSVSTQYAASGASVTLSSGASLTRSGFTLSRWDTASGGTGTPYSKSQSITMPAGGLTLYAVWTANATTTTAPATTTTVAVSTTTATPGLAGSGGSDGTGGAVVTPGATTLPPTASTAPGSTPTTVKGGAPATVATTPAGATAGSTPATTTTTLPAGSPGDGGDGDAPDVSGVGPGQVGATVNGAPAPATIEESGGSLVVKVGGLTVRYTLTSPDGLRRTVSSASALQLFAGDAVQVDFEGFGNDSTAQAWLVPGDTRIGSAVLTNGRGTVRGAVPTDASSGQRRIVTRAETPMGEPVVVAYGVTVTNTGNGGAAWSRFLLVLLGLAVLSGLLIPAARRRRKEEN